MDNNANNFETQFVQTIKTAPQPVEPVVEKPNHTNLIVTIIFTVVMVLQSVFLVVTLIKVSSLLEPEAEDEETIELDDSDSEDPFRYNEGGSLAAVDFTCNSEDGSSYTLTLDNNYEKQNASSEVIESGTYSVQNDLVFDFEGNNSSHKKLFYSEYILTDGDVFYNCDEMPSSEE